MKKVFLPAVFVFLVFLLAGLKPAGLLSAEIDCIACHEELTKGKVVHAALQMGCPACHGGIDAADVPHKKTNKNPHGLSSAVPELCYGCHDKGSIASKKSIHPPVIGGMCLSCHKPHTSSSQKLLLTDVPELCYSCHEKNKFISKIIHAPVGIGLCLNCHAPHQSDKSKLLAADIPDLCYNCHDKAAFEKKVTHAPVAGGMCLTCHSHHKSELEKLLLKRENRVCLGCHPNVAKEPHGVTGFSSFGHPIVGKKDPKRTGKKFGCISCHVPHTSEWSSLFRYKAEDKYDLCTYCHQM